MIVDKQNVNPNMSYGSKYKFAQLHQVSQNPKVSRFKMEDHRDWKRAVMEPSRQQKEFQLKLDRMIISQNSLKDCLRTTLSEDKLQNSFVSVAGNYTLQKYFLGEKSISREYETRRKQIEQIAIIVMRILRKKVESLESWNEDKILNFIKVNLKIWASEEHSTDRT